MQDSSAGSWALRKRKLFALMAWDCDDQFYLSCRLSVVLEVSEGDAMHT